MKIFFFFLTVLLCPQAHAAQTALWIPSQATGISDVIKILEENKNTRLTIALDAMPKSLETRAATLEKAGRLEVALRIPGEPPIPLFYYPASEWTKWTGKPDKSMLPPDNPYFMGLRLSMAADYAKRSLKRKPKGLVLPPGGIVADYFPIAKALGIEWLACGPFNYTEEQTVSSVTADTAGGITASSGIAAVPAAKPSVNSDSATITSAEPPAAENTEAANTESTFIADVNGIKVVSFTPYSGDISHGEPVVFDETSSGNMEQLRTELKKFLTGAVTEQSTVEALEKSQPAAEISAEKLAETATP